MNEFLSTTKKCRFELNVLPAKQTGLNYSWQPYFPEKGDPRKQGVLFFFGKFVAKLLKTIKKKMKKKKPKVRAELWATLIPVNLEQ